MNDHWRSWDGTDRWYDDSRRRDEDFRRNNDPTNPASASYWSGTNNLNSLNDEFQNGSALIDEDAHPILTKIGIGAFFCMIAVLLLVVPFWPRG